MAYTTGSLRTIHWTLRQREVGAYIQNRSTVTNPKNPISVHFCATEVGVTFNNFLCARLTLLRGPNLFARKQNRRRVLIGT